MCIFVLTGEYKQKGYYYNETQCPWQGHRVKVIKVMTSHESASHKGTRLLDMKVASNIDILLYI